MTSLADIGKFTGDEQPKEKTSVPVLTGADPVGQLEHQLERRGSFNPLEGTPGVPASLSLGASNRGDKSRSGPQVVVEGTSEEGYDSYDEVDLKKQRQESKDSLIVVPNNFKVKKGQKVTDELFIGEAIGKGLQGGVYNLVDKEGKVHERLVLKACHKYALLTKVKREWEVGRRVNSVFEPENALPGFMGTAHGLVTAKGRFRGMLLERLDGKPVTKVLKQPYFHDPQFVYDLLYGVFTTLDAAQAAVGFHHADFRLANVMEVREGSDQATAHTGAGAVKPGQPPAETINRFRIIDFGLADFSEHYAAGFVDMSNTTAIPRSNHHPLPSLPVTLQHLKAIPKVSLLERMYRYAWRHKGDVFNITWDLTRVLDGRVWPKEDERQVRLLLSFMHHVTGVRLRAWFVPLAEETEKGELRVNEYVCCPPVRKHTGSLHVLRIRAIRLRAWFNPKNPGITAGEALTSPFFKYEGKRGLNNGVGRPSVA